MIHKVLFLVPSAIGHYHPTLKLAAMLRSSGYTVAYAGNRIFKSMVEENGHTFYQLSYTEWLNMDSLPSGAAHQLKLFMRNIFDALTGERFKVFKAETNELKMLLKEIRPDFIFLDVFFDIQGLLLSFLHRNIYFMQTMHSTRKSANIPPLNAKYIPGITRYSNLYIDFLWSKHLLLRKMQGVAKRVIHFNQDKLNLLKRLTGKDVSIYRKIDRHRSFQFALRDYPEIMLSPYSLDYPWKPKEKNEYFMGYMAPVLKIPTDGTAEKLLALSVSIKNKQKKLVYISFGTLARVHKKNYLPHLEKILTALNELSELEVIVSMGNDYLKINKQRYHTATHFFEKVPQTVILNEADLFITHGGLNSIIESIYAQTPMLIFPLNNKWDQWGNAGRAIYHQLGIAGDLEKISPEEIKTKVQTLLSDDCYHKNIQRVREAMLSEKNNFEELLGNMALSQTNRIK